MNYIKVSEYESLAYQDKEAILKCLREGGICVFPTDSVYSLACLMSNKQGIQKIIKLTGKAEKKSSMSLLFHNLKTLADYTMNYNNTIFRAVKNLVPGPYTFIFRASKIVTKSFENTKKEVGVRIPDQAILREILENLEEPLISTSLNSGELQSFHNDPFAISEKYANDVDLVVDNGPTEGEVTTVLNCTGSEIELIREGKGVLN